jgi:adenine-specific DNA-methyltransferase
MAKKAGSAKSKGVTKTAVGYTHPDQTSPMRPEVGTQAQFRKKQSPVTYRYDSSLSPTLEWDGEKSARELGGGAAQKVDQYAARKVDHSRAVHSTFF